MASTVCTVCRQVMLLQIKLHQPPATNNNASNCLVDLISGEKIQFACGVATNLAASPLSTF